MKKYRLRIGLDVDDTLYECNAYALALLRAKYGDKPDYDLDAIRTWGTTGNAADERIAYFGDPDFVRTQPLYPGAQDFVRALCAFADVFFITAVPPRCMSARAERLCADFPEVPQENILIGTRKDIVDIDVLLDDAAHNVSASRATYPVLMRRPWNEHLSGLLSVNSYDDFVHLAHTIANSFVEAQPDLKAGGVLCLVGATGTGKTKIAEALAEDERFFRPPTTTTRARLPQERPDAYRFVSKRQFLAEKADGAFVETTVYGTHYFGTQLAPIEDGLAEGKIAVMPVDICGAVTLKNLFRTRAMLAFAVRDKRRIIADIVARDTDPEDKVNRLMSLDYEMRNGELCDFAVDIDNGMDAVLSKIRRKLGL